MENYRFDFVEDTEIAFENLELVGSIKAWTQDQKYAIVVLNLHQDLRYSLVIRSTSNDAISKEPTTEKALKKSSSDMLQRIKQSLIKRASLYKPPKDAALNFAQASLKPGEKVVDLASRVERLARKISSSILDPAIDQMIRGKIMENLPANISSLLRSFDDSSKDMVIRRAQNLLDGSHSNFAVTAVEDVNLLKKHAIELQNEIARLKIKLYNDRKEPHRECKKCGCASHSEDVCDGRV